MASVVLLGIAMGCGAVAPNSAVNETSTSAQASDSTVRNSNTTLSPLSTETLTTETQTPETQTPETPTLETEPTETGLVQVFAVTAQRCDRPTRFAGAAVGIGGNLVATAFHVVEGELRLLEVDGRPASVLAISPEDDLAILEVTGLNLAAPPIASAETESAQATLTTPEGRESVGPARIIALVVNDRDDATRFERRSFEFSGAQPEGVSGSALTTEAGELLGIVVLSNAERDVSYVSTLFNLEQILQNPTLAPTDLCT